MTPDDVLAPISRLKTGSRDGHRLPHKPFLVLLALGRWARGDRGPLPFADLEGPLGELIRTYGPPGAGNPQDPFWRLRRDGLWELGGTDRLAAPAAVAPPGLRELRAGVTGRFSAPVRSALAAEFTTMRQPCAWASSSPRKCRRWFGSVSPARSF